MPLLLLLFFIVPLIELYLLIQVGQAIGALPTIGLCVLTAVLGVALLRQQGFQTLQRARRNLDRGTVPAMEMLEGVALAAGGALLLTPGLVTDAIGFACLIPFTRRYLLRAVLRRAHITVGPVAGHSGHQPRSQDAIEGEFRRRDHD
ncbi:MAG: FxsA family protein [Aquisalimonadaceae bacterium]